MRRRTGSGDRQLDERIRELVETVDVADRDLLEDIVETSFRMARTANRGELKLVSRSFRELGRSFRIFAPYRERRKVSIFGSARTDETFELLTLMQTGKTAIRPVVLLEPEGSSYWSMWERFVRDHLVDGGLVSPEDLSLYELARSLDDAIAIIERFYSNYHSARYVG